VTRQSSRFARGRTRPYCERSTIPFLEHVVQDVRFAVRQLTKNRGFALTAILVLMLGIGASAAIFGFVDAALVKPLPYRDPTRLVGVTESTAQIPRANLSIPDYLDWKRLNSVFSSLEVYGGRGQMLSTATGTQLVSGARVSARYSSAYHRGTFPPS
jgi:macrolide transport system ATP-binding/permease protein